MYLVRTYKAEKETSLCHAVHLAAPRSQFYLNFEAFGCIGNVARH